MSKKEKLNVTISALDELKVGLDSHSVSSLVDEEQSTQRGLSLRHMQFIALGGAIGTGIFIGSGSGLATCGPGGLLVGYLILSVFVFFVMSMLCEMVTLLPIAGEGTLYATLRRYVGRGFSIACGYNIYYGQAMIPPTEVTACAYLIQYWSDANPAIWISIFLVVTILINVLPVKFFGELEFFVLCIKILTICGLLILGLVIFFGGAPNQHGVQGFKFWQHPGAFTEHLSSGSTGKFLACWTAIIKAGFAFILCPELITLCLAEAEYPRRNLPIVCRRFIYRLLFFYIGSVIVIGVIVAYNDPGLLNAIDLGASNAAASPFVIGMNNVGIRTLPHILNACILTSAYLAGTSMLYGSSRMLHSMALQGDAPKIFSRTTKHGVPMYAVGVTSLFNFLAYLNCSNSAATVFTWLSNIATIAGFVSWMFVSMTYICYKRVITVQQLESRVPFKPRFNIYAAYALAVFFFLLSLTNGYGVFVSGNWSTADFFSAYVTLIIVVVILVGALTWQKEWTRPIKNPADVYMMDVIAKAEADEIEHKDAWDEKMATQTGFGWRILHMIF